MSNSINVICLIKSVELLVKGVVELGLAVKDLRDAKKEIRELENCQGEKVQVDYIITNVELPRFGGRVEALRSTRGQVLSFVLHGRSVVQR